MCKFLAANSFFKDGAYQIKDKSSAISDQELLEYYKGLADQYKLAALEDPFAEDAWDSWNRLSTELSDSVLIIGDDLLATNPKRVQKAIAEKSWDCAIDEVAVKGAFFRQGFKGKFFYRIS